jgi:cation:H+ antiporter
MMSILMILLGFGALLLGGEYLVRGAVAIARRFDVSPMVIGLTLVGFGTSMPELLTSLQAAFAGSPGIAIGNVVGSNIANILLILGVAAVIAPVAVSQGSFRRDAAIVALATGLCIVLALSGTFSRINGAIFLAGLAGFLWLAFRQDDGNAATGAEISAPAGFAISLVMFAGGLIVTLIGARLLVLGAVDLARLSGISEAVIGLTIVAVGTSLPELVTSVVAARKGHSDVALGNVIGSNIFNILGILGVTALARPITVPPEIIGFDIWVMAAATAAMIWICVSGWRVSRGEGVAMLTAYACYLGFLAL